MPKSKLIGRVSVGRNAEFRESLKNPELVAVKSCGWDYEYHQFGSRAFLENMLSKQGNGTNNVWHPVCPLASEVPNSVSGPAWERYGTEIVAYFRSKDGWKVLLKSGDWVLLA